MANKDALKELQTRLARRLSEARLQAQEESWLAVEVAQRGLLLPLAQAGEIFPVVPFTVVAHTQPWFLGVANLRGHLQGVVHLAPFLGERHRAGTAELDGSSVRDGRRLVSLGSGLGVQCALLVDALAGLRRASQMKPVASPDARSGPYWGPSLEDEVGRVWQVLDLQHLAADETFLRVAI